MPRSVASHLVSHLSMVLASSLAFALVLTTSSAAGAEITGCSGSTGAVGLQIEPTTFVAHQANSKALVILTNIETFSESGNGSLIPANPTGLLGLQATNGAGYPYFEVSCDANFGVISEVSLTSLFYDPAQVVFGNGLGDIAAYSYYCSSGACDIPASVIGVPGATGTTSDQLNSNVVFFSTGTGQPNNDYDCFAYEQSMGAVITFTPGNAGIASCNVYVSGMYPYVSPPSADFNQAYVDVGHVRIAISPASSPFGPVGPTGPAGANGTNGENGTNGTNGTNGATGATGATGAAGAAASIVAASSASCGSAGGTLYTVYIGGVAQTPAVNICNGAAGAAGPAGAAGVAGARGATGATGVNGTNGSNGATGATGATGSAGAAGAAGPAGARGATGATGPTGASGSAAAQGAPGPTGATGPAGAAGIVGPAGASPVLSTASVTGPSCGAAGGTQYTFTLDGAVISTTVICNGAAGGTGNTGPTGPTGPMGTAGLEGPTGPEGSTGQQSSGSGGCSTAPWQPSSAAFFLLAAGLVARRRRRESRHDFS